MASNTGSRPFWTRELIIEAFKRFEREYGHTPDSRILHTRRRPEWMPSAGTVRVRFGSFNAAMEAAGFTSRSPGVPGHIVSLDRDKCGKLKRA